MPKPSGSTVTLTGILQPSAWDERGRVTALALATDTEEEFEVEAGRALSGMIRLLSEEVAVRGRIRRRAGRRVVEGAAFCRVDDAPGPQPRDEAYGWSLEEVS